MSREEDNNSRRTTERTQRRRIAGTQEVSPTVEVRTSSRLNSSIREGELQTLPVRHRTRTEETGSPTVTARRIRSSSEREVAGERRTSREVPVRRTTERRGTATGETRRIRPAQESYSQTSTRGEGVRRPTERVVRSEVKDPEAELRRANRTPISTEPVSHVRRTEPSRRTQVATSKPDSILEERPIVVDTPRREKELPSAAFGSWRPKKAMPAPKKKVDEEGRAVDKATFASDKEIKFRHELKFYINYRDYMVLRQQLKVLLTPDDNGDENNSYHIRSLYFDDKDEKALVEKMAGVEMRNKYRIRIYNFSDQIIRLEKKIKCGQYIGKESMTLTREEYDAIIDGKPEFLLHRKEKLAREMFIEMRINHLTPRVVVDYMREAYIMPYESVRITFDKELKSGRPTRNIFDRNLPVIPIADADTMILEVKFNKYLPDYVRSVLAGLTGPERSSISKYVNCRKYE